MNAAADSFAQWIGEFASDTRIVVYALFAGSLIGILAAAFTLGGVWAVRGRPALCMPRCARCKALLRGSGLDVPTRCSECGRELGSPRAVLWLRFRRQPLTLLVTFPVVVLGGVALASNAVLLPLRAFEWRIHSMKLSARHDGVAVAAPEPPVSDDDSSEAPPDEPSPPRSLLERLQFAKPRDLVARLWRGGEEGTVATVVLAEWTWRLRGGESPEPRDAEAAISVLVDLSEGRVPDQPLTPPNFETAVGRQVAYVRLRRWREIAFHIAAVLANQPSLAASRETIQRHVGTLVPPVDCWHPRRAAGGQLFGIRTRPVGGSELIATGIETVRIDGREVWSARTAPPALAPRPRPQRAERYLKPRLPERVELPAPEKTGLHEIEVETVAEVFPYWVLQSSGPLGARRTVHRSRIEVVADEEPLPSLSAAEAKSERERAVSDEQYLRSLVTVEMQDNLLSGGSGSLLSVSIRRTGPLALSGLWEVSIAGAFTPLGRQEAVDEELTLFAFDERDSRDDRRVLLRFTPDREPRRGSSSAMGAMIARDAVGVNTTPFEIECVRTPGAAAWTSYNPVIDEW